MKKQTQILAIAILAVLIVLSYCHFRSSTPEVPAVEPEEIGSLPPSEKPQQPKAEVPPPAAPANNFLPTEMEDPQRFEVLHDSLQEMNKCLEIQVPSFDKNADFSYESLNSMLVPFLGDSVMKTDEWKTTDIQTANGEIRRIYLEYNTDIVSEISTALRYVSISPTGEVNPLPLTAEQSQNPSEALIASLEGDGTVLSRSQSQRTFYQNGGNLVTVERNGKIYSMQVFGTKHSFRCEGMDAAATFKCRCI